MKIIWSEPAVSDFSEIVEYISRDKPKAASNLARTVLECVEQLLKFPASGRRLPELPGEPYRELIIPPVRVIYRILSNKNIFIARLIRSERNIFSVLK